MTIETMLYRRYKQHYADCETVAGSYNKEYKTIEVIIPEGRMKPSGTRGQTFHYMVFWGTDNATGQQVLCTIKATCRANAIKRLPPDCTWDLT